MKLASDFFTSKTTALAFVMTVTLAIVCWQQHRAPDSGELLAATIAWQAAFVRDGTVRAIRGES